MLIYNYKKERVIERNKEDNMNLKYTKSYDNTVKKLKKFTAQKETLNIILDIINNSTDFDELKNNPIVRMYRFERLKYELNEFYSFSLEKSGGVIRLIVRPVNNNLLELSYISYDHYEDFNEERVIYYDE